MKKLKQLVTKLVAGALAVTMLAGACPVTEVKAAETGQTTSATKVVNYVALGDSITAASDSYVRKVSNYLSNTYGACNTSNLAVNAWKSADLLNALRTNSNYRSKVAGADVITVDIGSNDVLVTAREVAANAIGCTEKELDVTVIRMLTDLQNSSGFQAMIKGAKVYALAYKVKHELNSGAKMKSIESTFEQNFKSIMLEIKALNPNAKVYIGNLYNPYIEAAPMCIGDIELVNLEVMSETYINKLNTIIKNNSNESIVVDLYSVIRNPKYIKGDVRNHDYDPHPNSEGQKLIADKFIAKVK